MTTLLRYFPDTVNDLLGVPSEQDWKLSTMVAFGYPLGKWGIAADRHPVHEVSSRNRWGAPFGIEVPRPLWPTLTETATDVVLRPSVRRDMRC